MLLSVRAIAEQKVEDSFKNFSLGLMLPINGSLQALGTEWLRKDSSEKDEWEIQTAGKRHAVCI